MYNNTFYICRFEFTSNFYTNFHDPSFHFVKIMLKKLAGRSFDSPCHISFKSTFKHLHVSRSNAFRIAATTFRPEISVPIRAKSQPLTVVAVCSQHWHAGEFRIRGSCFQVKVAARSTVRSFSHPPFVKIAESCLIKNRAIPDR